MEEAPIVLRTAEEEMAEEREVTPVASGSRRSSHQSSHYSSRRSSSNYSTPHGEGTPAGEEPLLPLEVVETVMEDTGYRVRRGRRNLE